MQSLAPGLMPRWLDLGTAKPARPRRWLRRGAQLATVLAGALAIAWTSLGSWSFPAIGPPQRDYYNLLVAGFRKGSLALDLAVPEALRQAENPWDPARRPPNLGFQDISYNRGRFYSYFGVVPTVVLYWPFRAVTGHDLPQVLGTLGFSLGAFLLAAGLWLRLLRDHFPRAGLATELGGVLALGLAGGQWVLARRVSIWEPSIAAGHFFVLCLLASGYLAGSSRRPGPWLAAAGLALGLAVGSRPPLAVAVIGLLGFVIAFGLRARPAGTGPAWRPIRRAALAAGLPLAAVLAGLLAYNQARFGSPWEFGLNYQLTSVYEAKARHFSLSFAPFNFFAYFLAAPQWGRYFPFVHPIAPRTMPAGYYGYEYVYGALVVCPVLWWAAALPFLIRRGAPAVRSFAVIVAGIAGATTAVLLCFNTAAARYETDFLPWWVWLALLGWALVEDALSTGAARAVLRGALAAGAAVSCLAAGCASAELHEILAFENPAAYRRLARIFNTPVACWERLQGYRGGGLSMDLAFADHPRGSVEPLVVTGVEYQKDYVFLYYQSDRVVRFCYSHAGAAAVSSLDVTFLPGRAYPVRVEFGALFPPEAHPVFDGWDQVQVAAVKRWVTVEFDGKVVLSEPAVANDASPGTVKVGQDPAGAYGRRFSGRITEVRRLDWSKPEVDLRGAGDLDLALALPSRQDPGNQPLMEAGRPGRADIMGLRRIDAGHVGFLYESWGDGLWQSDPVAIAPDGIESFRLRLGPLLAIPDESPLAILGKSVVVWRRDSPVWWTHTAIPLDQQPPLYLLANTIGSSAMGPAFQGRLLSAHRSPLHQDWHPGPFRTLELELGGRGRATEPLVATGGEGHGDMLGIEWLQEGRARFIYDHWGGELQASPPLPWPATGLHRLRLELPSFRSLDGRHPSGEARGRLLVDVDGTTRWDASVLVSPATSASVAIGRNLVHFSSTYPELTCAVLSIGQDTLAR